METRGSEGGEGGAGAATTTSTTTSTDTSTDTSMDTSGAEGMGVVVPESLKRLVDGSVDATVVVDRAYRVHHHNAAWQALTGLRPRALAMVLDGDASAGAGRRSHDLLHLEACGEDCVMRRAVECGKPIRMDEV